MTQQRKSFRTYLIAGFFAAVIVIVLGWDPEKLLFHQLCDGAFVAAVILLGIGGLKFARNGGTFDVMAWGISSVVRMTVPWLFKESKDADLIAYKERKSESRQSAKPELLSGVIYLVLSLIFFVIYLLQT